MLRQLAPPKKIAVAATLKNSPSPLPKVAAPPKKPVVASTLKRSPPTKVAAPPKKATVAGTLKTVPLTPPKAAATPASGGARFSPVLQMTLTFEGGYVNNAKDVSQSRLQIMLGWRNLLCVPLVQPGGITNLGVTQNSWKEYVHQTNPSVSTVLSRCGFYVQIALPLRRRSLTTGSCVASQRPWSRPFTSRGTGMWCAATTCRGASTAWCSTTQSTRGRLAR